ncbi:hypothetical protein, partial [Brevundimonas diminuta]|uniref:hypothetical protein n=1 Tax=Brevundimonas diminuta TaxID=293 RepID=UPI003F492047
VPTIGDFTSSPARATMVAGSDGMESGAAAGRRGVGDRGRGGGVLDRSGGDGDFALHLDLQIAALDFDLGQVGVVQNVGQAADQVGVDVLVLSSDMRVSST